MSDEASSPLASDATATGTAAHGMDEDGTVVAEGASTEAGAAATGATRRRRRGGRGRNRRDRVEGESAEGASDSAIAVDASSGDEPADEQEEPHAAVAAATMPVAEEASPASGEAATPATESAMGDGSSVTSAPIVGETDAALVLETAAAAPLVEPVAIVEPIQAVPPPVVEAAPVVAEPVVAEPEVAEPLVAKATMAPPMLAAPVLAVDLDRVLSNAGLQLVNTDAGKLASVRALGVEVAPVLRPQRERKRIAPPPAEPLAQVETTRKH
jgi:ribonuclease E